MATKRRCSSCIWWVNYYGSYTLGYCDKLPDPNRVPIASTGREGNCEAFCRGEEAKDGDATEAQ